MNENELVKKVLAETKRNELSLVEQRVLGYMGQYVAAAKSTVTVIPKPSTLGGAYDLHFEGGVNRTNGETLTDSTFSYNGATFAAQGRVDPFYLSLLADAKLKPARETQYLQALRRA